MSATMTSPAPWLGHLPPMPVPTMLARAELDYLSWLAADSTGAGRLCELGCFLGGSTWALASGLPPGRPPVLTYDAFRMDAETAAQFPVGCADGESFRPVFEQYLAPHRGRVVVREGFIPRDLPVDREREVYPEQEPIEILFNDAAKTWLVHNTILRCFGRHLIPGRSILIQQDFKHFGGYWIPLHMWQLRECFEPLHDIEGGATHSFLCRASLAEKLGSLWGPQSLGSGEIEGAWDRVEGYWAGTRAVRWFMRLCRATHLASAGLVQPCMTALESVAAGCRPAELGADGPPITAELVQTCDMALRLLSRSALDPGSRNRLLQLRAAGLASASATRGGETDLWQALAASLRVAGHRRIALYGAGRQTARLLASGWPGGGIEVAAILDDFALTRAIEGVPVLRPQAAPPIDAVVIASEAHEQQLAQAAANVFGTCLPIIGPSSAHPVAR